MKLILFNRTQHENLTASKINRLLELAGLPRRRPSVIGGRYFAFALSREEAEAFQVKFPSPMDIQHVEGSVEYLLGTMPTGIRRHAGIEPARDNEDSRI
jgi:hypothetical protein